MTGLRNREPSVRVLSSDATSTKLIVGWQQKNMTTNITGHGEMPARISGRKYTYTKATHVLTADAAEFVIAEQAGWASGSGHQQGCHFCKVLSGSHAGRLLCVYAQNDAAGTTFNTANDRRNIYLKYSDDDGGTWSAGLKIVNATLLDTNLTSNQSIVTPGNGSFIQIPAGTYAGRVAFPIYYSRSAIAYSDDGGDTWAVGGTSPSVAAASEPNLTVWPNGTLIMTLRIDNNVSGTRRWLKSTDGGATWSDAGDLPGYQATTCNAGVIQTDPSGALGTYGKIVISAPEGTAGNHDTRDHFALRSATDAALTLANRYALFNASQYIGYSALDYADATLFVAYETGSAAFNIDERVELAAVNYP